MDQKKKLMVVLGAGASIELGMPSVNNIDRLFCEWALDGYKLSNDESQSLYSYIRDEINRHYSFNPKSGMVKQTNFEEILYVILQLSAILSDDNYNLPMNAFFGLKKLPKINSYRGEKFVDGNDLRQLCSFLLDRLISEFRVRCDAVRNTNQTEFVHFKNFIHQLNTDYDAAFITLNYDNLITQVCSDLFTGFSDTTGSFVTSSIYERESWGLIYHLHGSVHFDMQGEPLDMHAIKWNPDLNSTFQGNSLGRNAQDTAEGIQMPTSVIVAGYGKTSQIQRVPFRTYYTQLDRLVESSDAVLFLGYGFNDLHLNNCCHSIRKNGNKKPVVIIDWAADDQDPLQSRQDVWSYNLCKTIPVNAREMATRQQHAPPNIAALKSNEEFEVSRNPEYPLSIWYGGFINACQNYTKIKAELVKAANKRILC